MENNNQPLTWSVFNLWNTALEKREDRPIKERYNMWASELGGPHIDRYLKMKGVTPTNPPNARSLRKFDAGNRWEAIIKFVLDRAGILIDQQKWLEFQYPGLLSVTGKLDFIAGGQPDFQTALELIENDSFLAVDKALKTACIEIVKGLQSKFSIAELKKIVIEVKSCSSFMFDVYERSGSASPNHRLQLYHYLKATGLDEGHILYVCKDDCRMLEIGVMNPSPVEDEYKADIELMTKYIQHDIKPPLEKAIVFDRDFAKFSANWKVAYSGYLTYLYGIKSQMDFDNVYKPKAEQWNRVIKRAVQFSFGEKTPKGKPILLTKENLEIIEEIKKDFPNYGEIVAIARQHKQMLDERNITEDTEAEQEADIIAVP